MPQPQYNGWLVSPNFLKRCFAVFGHMLVAQLIIVVPIWIVMFLLVGSMFIKSGAVLQPSQLVPQAIQTQ